MSGSKDLVPHKVTLCPSDLIGQGNERLCYTNPVNTDTCIKVTYREHRKQNKIEKYYYQKLTKRKNLSPYLSTYYGEIDTNLGQGLVFEKVLDQDGSSSQSLYTLLKNNTVTLDEAKKILRNLFDDLYKNAILLGDVTKDQVLLKETEDGYVPKIIDGLGTRRYGLKLFLISNLKFVARIKLKRRWNKLENAIYAF